MPQPLLESPPTSLLSGLALRPLWAAGLLAAALLTIGPALPGGAQSADGPDLATGGPLADGHFTTFANGDRVNAILRVDDVVWSATDGGGLVRWSLSADPSLAGDSYRQFLSPQDGLPSNRINDIVRSSDGLLWLATQRGLVRFDTDSGDMTTYAPDPADRDNPNGMPARPVRVVLERNDGRLWVGFGQEWDDTMENPHPRVDGLGAYRPGGVALFDPVAETWSHRMNPRTDRGNYTTISSENITDLAYDSDGNLWIASEQYLQFEQTCHEPGNCTEGWVLGGGGLIVTDLDSVVAADLPPEDAVFVIYRPADNEGSASGACFSDNVSDLEPDVDGRMWVGTHDRGLLLFQFGLQRIGCSGLPYYRPVNSGGPVSAEGLRGRHVYAVDIDSQNRVWIAHGAGRDEGEGVAVLTHNGTFEDSSASKTPWTSDDQWRFLTLDGVEDGGSDKLVTALDVSRDGQVYMGTRSDRFGDGYGIRRYIEAEERWVPLRTADNGLASNQLRDVQAHPTRNEVWFALERHGVSMFDGERWHWWRAFGAGSQVAQVTGPARSGLGRIAIDIPDRDTYDQVFNQRVNYIKIGEDPIRYRVVRFRPKTNGLGPFIDIRPDLGRNVLGGTPIFLTDRGPASDHASQIAFDAEGRVYVGGRESIWLPRNECSEPPECWLDGGLGRWDGTNWSVWDQTRPVDALDGTGVIDQEVKTVAADAQGRIWTGTGSPSSSSGDGMSVFDPATETFIYHYLPPQGGSGLKLGGNGIGDLSLDSGTGDMYAAHFPAKKLNSAPDGTLSQVFFGGGVSRWNGSEWSFWRKDKGALLRAYKDGTFESVLADRQRNLLWLGGWDGDRGFHWLNGFGVNATLNWCPLDACTNESWKHRTWDGQGEVRDMALDPFGNLWVGLHRRGFGQIPPEAGLRVYDDTAWYVHTKENSGLVSNEIQSVSRDGDGMWVGTLQDGAAYYDFEPRATPTPLNSPTPSKTPTATPRNTIEPTETMRPPTVTPTFPPGVTPPTPTRRPPPTRDPNKTPFAACYSPRWPGWCDVYLPFGQLREPGKIIRPAQATPLRVLPTATPTNTPRPSATLAPSATPRISPTPTRTPPPSATPVPPTPTLGSTPATATASPTATTAPPTMTPTATMTPERPPIGTWSNFNSARSLTRETLNDVHGPSAQQVVMVGNSSTVLIWDGVEMTSGSAVGGRTLNTVFMLDSRFGFIGGDRIGQNGTMLSTTTGGQQWRINNTSHLDDWVAVSAVRGGQGTRGLLLGRDRGSRLFYDGALWDNQSGADLNNTSHEYSAIAMVSETHAVAVSSALTGARIHTWNGTTWSPGPVTGSLHDIHMRSATVGAAVGASGRIWVVGPDGEWRQMSSRPQTAGRDLKAVHMIADDMMWVAGERGGLWLWNGTEWSTGTVSGVSRDLNALWFSDDGRRGWAVGVDGTILRYVAP